jgi:hypothetical protein
MLGPLTLGLLLASRTFAEEAEPAPRAVGRDELLEAMRHSQGYDPTATANGPRLMGEVLRRLILEGRERDQERRPLFIGHREWFDAFLARTALTPERAPLYARLSHDVGQDVEVDWRRERVIEAVLDGPEPLFAANVRVAWAGGRNSFSYDDRLARPNLRVTQKRLISYRFVGYDDQLWYAEVEGLHGRPTSGAMGKLFDLIGEARVLESRSAFAEDGVQVARARGKKFVFQLTETVVLWPDGRAERGVPPGRSDLAALDMRLRRPLAIRFRPYPP